MTNNPLAEFFRQPAIYLRLPSGGKFYPPGSIDMPPNGELPVFPMTARDEVTYRTPDALFNGSAVVSVIQSCVPNIKDAWSIPSADLDSILVAIRIASYGHELEMWSTCPKCNNEAEYGVDLRALNDSIRLGNYDQSIIWGDLEFFFKPLDYGNVNANNHLQFEQQQILGQLTQDDIPENQKATNLGMALRKINEITTKAIVGSVAAVKTPSSLVSETEYIEELLLNCDRKLFAQIRDHIIKLKTQSEIQPIKITCSECSNEYEQPFTLDMSSFFADAS